MVERPIKIVMICEFFAADLGFQENFLVKYYRKFGHDLTIITSTYKSVFEYYSTRYDANAKPSQEYHLGVKIIRLPYRFRLLNKLPLHPAIRRSLPLAGMADALAAEKPDLIYVHDVAADFPILVRYVVGNRNTQMIMDYHCDYANSGKGFLSRRILHGMVRKRWLDRARPYLRKIFPIVPDGFKFLNEIYGVPYSEMEILPLGADLDLAKEIRVTGGAPRCENNTIFRRNVS